jgi:hypothetical protein
MFVQFAFDVPFAFATSGNSDTISYTYSIIDRSDQRDQKRISILSPDKDRLGTAIANARRLKESYEINGRTLSNMDAPVTSVHELILELYKKGEEPIGSPPLNNSTDFSSPFNSYK